MRGLAMLISSLIASVAGVYAFKFHGFRSVHGKSLLFLDLAVTVLFIGNAIMTFFTAVLGVPSSMTNAPTEALIFWLMQYPFYIAGLYFVWKMTKVPIDRKRLVSMCLLVATISIFSISMFITSTPKGSDNGSILAQISAFGDMLILNALIVMVMHSFGGKLFRLWSIILLSIFILTISHITISIDALVVMGLTLMEIGFLSITFGFLYNVEMFRDMAEKTPEPPAKKGIRKGGRK